VLQPQERNYLATVARIFGIGEAEFGYIMARHCVAERRSPYDVLGVAPEISDEDLQRYYRKMMVENHPDKLVARGLPQEMIDIANKKIAAINEAYDEIRRERRRVN
jgi:DnaJ like chaperone protein